jgi:tagatose-6-phosphate ketose/aldose isomerase
MNAFTRLATSLQPLLTMREINQQPAVWRKTLEVLRAQREALAAFLEPRGQGAAAPALVLAGAGSSEYVGRSIEAALRRTLQRDVSTVPTTHFVTHAETVFLPGREYILASFARSGNSPESLATFRRVREQYQQVRQLAITCNQNGGLAREAAMTDGSLCVVLPEETNDASLAMTSSFSSLALAGLSLGYLDSFEEFDRLVAAAAAGAERVIYDYGDLLQDFARMKFTRACYLGSNALLGAMQEGRLKMQEMTAGRVVSMFESFLGLRHGPQVFVNEDCIVVAALCSNHGPRQYEIDLLRELKGKKQGMGTLVICGKPDAELRSVADYIIELFPTGDPLPDDCRVLTDIVVCQILAAFTSIGLGLSPDNPSPDGIIHRVVEGVTIYPW